MRWEKVTLIGVGLLGGSLGMALKQRRQARQVVGYVRRTATIRESLGANAVDHATLDLIEAVDGADLLVLCTPIAQMRGLVQCLLPALKPGAIVTDVGSVKGTVVSDLETLVARGGGHFVGSHPMAGSEKTGVLAARSDLFVRAICVVTPTPRSAPAAVRAVEGLWRCVGARLLRLSADLHDDLVSRSSHLPHVVAAELANFVLAPGRRKEQGLLCANGFRDTTRIAAGSAEMWRDITLANRKNLDRALAALVRDLDAFRRALRRRDEAAIAAFFNRARERLELWSRRAASQSPE